MKWLKYALIAIGLILAVMLIFPAIGFIYHALWYVFLVGVVAGGGYVGYKLLKKKHEPLKLKEKKPIGIAEIENADRTLDEYKRKYLPK